ncbi:MAG: chloride channel protein [bacterium]|nr:chloride channel protein [bacterium]
MSSPENRSFVHRLRELQSRWIIYGIAVGLASGLAAVIFFLALEAASHLSFNLLAHMPQPAPPGDQIFHSEVSPGEPRRWLFFILPAIGGLLSGLIVYRFAPEAAGPGTDEMINSFHRGRGMVPGRVPFIKGLATLLTLGTGGSAGKEGPIAQIGAGIGSFLAVRFGLSARDRRILLLAGTAGGLGAIFRAPLGSAITAIEVLYKEDFESDALIPSVISSVTAYILFMLLLGGERIFAIPSLALVTPIEIPGYLVLALVTVPVGRGYIWLYYWLSDRVFPRIPGPRAIRPMIGGLCVGFIGLWYPEAYGAGWGYIQKALDGEMVLTAMAWIVAAKILSTCLTIGSGGSGGVFGPTLFIGGMLGATIGYGGELLSPELFPNPAAFVLVGMASFFAGVASAPIGAMLMVTEMTGGYALLPPLMLVSVISMILTRGTSIYKSQVKDRFHSPAHVSDLTINVLEEMLVADVFRASEDVPTVSPGARFEALRGIVLGGRDATVPVVNPTGKLVGLLTAEQIRPVMDDHHLDRFVVAGDIAAPPVSVLPDDDLYRAHELFRVSGCPQIPVLEPPIEGSETSAIIGMLDYRDMMNAYGRELAKRRET